MGVVLVILDRFQLIAIGTTVVEITTRIIDTTTAIVVDTTMIIIAEPTKTTITIANEVVGIGKGDARTIVIATETGTFLAVVAPVGEGTRLRVETARANRMTTIMRENAVGVGVETKAAEKRENAAIAAGAGADHPILQCSVCFF